MRGTTLIVSLIAALLLLGCAGAQRVGRGETYVAPLGAFTCGPLPLDARIQAAFGPHGGTVRIFDEVAVTRVDVEEFQPALDRSVFEQTRERVYSGYLHSKVLPLVVSGVPTASIIGEQPSMIDGLQVYESAILLPNASGATSGKGTPIDGIRGQVHYSNGRFIYTVSVISVAWSASREQNVERAALNAGRAFKRCKFPN